MKKYNKHLFMFWLPVLLLIFTLFSIGNSEAFIVWLVFTLIAGGICFIIYKTEYITIDGNMVEGKVGLLTTQKLSSNKKNISAVKVTKDILGRILNYGTITITSASSDYTFKMMKNPDEIKNIILK